MRLTPVPTWTPTPAEVAAAAVLIFLSALAAAVLTLLAVKAGVPVLAPVAPLAVGVSWGRGRLGGWLFPWRRW